MSEYHDIVNSDSFVPDFYDGHIGSGEVLIWPHIFYLKIDNFGNIYCSKVFEIQRKTVVWYNTCKCGTFHKQVSVKSEISSCPKEKMSMAIKKYSYYLKEKEMEEKANEEKINNFRDQFNPAIYAAIRDNKFDPNVFIEWG